LEKLFNNIGHDNEHQTEKSTDFGTYIKMVRFTFSQEEHFNYIYLDANREKLVIPLEI
jgi:hypothetical protein